MNLLFVANFSADTGYAWATIEAVLRRVGERLVEDGHTVTIAYAAMPQGPSIQMRGAPFDFITFDYARTTGLGGALAFARTLRSRKVDALYLTDQNTWSWQYLLYRAAGVRRLILHDRTSGDRDRPGGLARLVKRALHSVRWLSADACIAVSRYVMDRLIEVNRVPPRRVHLVYNGIDLQRFDVPVSTLLHELTGVPASVPLVICSGRAQPYKGFQTVIDAAALLQAKGVDAGFVYCGDGPYLRELQGLAAGRGLKRFFFLGKRTDVPQLLKSATICVVPSLWAEAFGLTVVEGMAAGLPVIASAKGGIPEILEEVGGVLVPAGDASALAGAMRQLIGDEGARKQLGARGRTVACEKFSLERVANNLYGVLSSQLKASTARS